MKAKLTDDFKDTLTLGKKHIHETNKAFDIDDSVILGLSLSIITKTEDVLLLIDNKRFSSVEGVMRTILEQYVYLKYIIEKDTKQLSYLMFCSYKIQSAQTLMKTLEQIHSSGGYKNIPTIDINDIESIKKEVPHANSPEEYIDYYKQEFKKNLVCLPKNNKEPNYQQWFNANRKINNFKDLMDLLKLDKTLYTFLYKLKSLNVHGIDVIGNYKIEGKVLSYSKKISAQETDSMLNYYIVNSVFLVAKHYKLEDNKQYKEIKIRMRLRLNINI